MNALLRLSCLLFLIVMAWPGPAFSGESGEPQKQCEKSVGSQGLPNSFSAIASLNAVRAWVELTKTKYGAGYAMWHNAAGKALKCEPIQRSTQIRCFAKARPCKAQLDTASAGKQAARN